MVKSQQEVILEFEGIYPWVGSGLELSVAFSLWAVHWTTRISVAMPSEKFLELM